MTESEVKRTIELIDTLWNVNAVQLSFCPHRCPN